MKRIIFLFLTIILFGCIQPEEKAGLGLSEIEISVDDAKIKLQEAETIGIIFEKKDITQENFVKVLECVVGYSYSLGGLNKTVMSYGVEGDVCMNEILGESTVKLCSEHIKENTQYNIYLLGGKEAETKFYEDHMLVIVPENNEIECKIN